MDLDLRDGDGLDGLGVLNVLGLLVGGRGGGELLLRHIFIYSFQTGCEKLGEVKDCVSVLNYGRGALFSSLGPILLKGSSQFEFEYIISWHFTYKFAWI